jgi:hypothetical protein
MRREAKSADCGAPRVHRKSMPEGLENLIVACLERNPDYRFSGCEIPVLT